MKNRKRNVPETQLEKLVSRYGLTLYKVAKKMAEIELEEEKHKGDYKYNLEKRKNSHKISLLRYADRKQAPGTDKILLMLEIIGCKWEELIPTLKYKKYPYFHKNSIENERYSQIRNVQETHISANYYYDYFCEYQDFLFVASHGSFGHEDEYEYDYFSFYSSTTFPMLKKIVDAKEVEQKISLGGILTYNEGIRLFNTPVTLIKLEACQKPLN